MTKINSSKGFVMGLFNTILSKLGLGKKEEADAPKAAAPAPAPKPAVAPAKPAAPSVAKPAAPAPAASAGAKAMSGMKREEEEVAHAPTKAAEPAVKAISEVDVLKKLEELTEGSGLDWKVSIVDLLKVLKIDSSLAARKELAQELGCPAELIGGDYSKMNVWLHKTVLKKIAENGGNIPASMLD